MSLRWKVLLIAGVASAALFCGLYLTVARELSLSVERIEQAQARADLARVQAAVEHELASLDATAADYAYWDDTYHYLLTGDPEFVQTNLTPAALVNLSINLFALARGDGEIVGAVAVDLDTGEPAAPPAALADRTGTLSRLLTPSTADESRTGIVLLDGEPMLLAVRAVLTSDRRGPSPGVLIAGRWLDASVWDLVSQLTQLEVTGFLFGSDSVAPEVAERLGRWRAGSDPVLERLGEDRVAAYGVLHDPDGMPVVIVRAVSPRPARALAEQARLSLALGLGFVVLVWAALTIFFLDRLILARLSRLGSSLAEIERRGNPSGRVKVEGKDEIGHLGATINRTLGSLEQSQRDLQQSEERYRSLLESQGEGFVLVDEQERVLFANPAAEALFGVAPGGLQGRSLQEFTGPDTFAVIRLQMQKRRAGRTTTYEIDIRRPDGQKRRLMITGSPYINAQGSFLGSVGVLRDITERHEMERRLEYLSTHDPLTGLYNRGFFDEELQRLERGRRFPVTILVGDVDGLKPLNDLEGHAAGDRLLKRAARLLADAFRGDDVVARIGGDEFAVILPQTDAAAGERALQRLRARLEEHNRAHPDQPLHMSLGLATGEKGRPLAEVVAEADRQMYQAKLQRMDTLLARRRGPGPR